MKSNSIKIYARESSINFYSWALIADGFFLSPSVKRYLGKPFKLAIAVIKNDAGEWGADEKNWNDLGKNLNKRLFDGSFPLSNALKILKASLPVKTLSLKPLPFLKTA